MERYRNSGRINRVELPDRTILLKGDTAEVDVDNSSIAVLIRAGVLVPESVAVEKPKPRPKAVAPIDEDRGTLEGIPVSAALVLIKAEDMVETLEAWLEDDPRKTVKAAIEKRLSELG